jgi:RNA polymerase sigma-70 factor (ECF subfamily)
MPAPLSVATIYERNRHFLWASLHRLGVPDADLPDALQEVLMVVHRRIASFNGTSKLSTWLFGICLRVAAAQRRKAHVRRERLTADPALDEPTAHTEHPALVLDARRQLASLLDQLKLEHRAVFVMFELEGLTTAEIAEQLGSPIGTVHSRLHHARQAFKAALARYEAKERHGSKARRGRR